MFSLFGRSPVPPDDLVSSKLYDQDTFYSQFTRDLRQCMHEVMIESPFITDRRFQALKPTLEKLLSRGVKIIINTRHPTEHEDEFMRQDAMRVITNLLDMEATVLYTGGHHRKLAILDRRILFEGSLNILSQSQSCEIMRRIDSPLLAEEMARFIKLDKVAFL